MSALELYWVILFFLFSIHSSLCNETLLFQLIEASETASEAWSTDVVASDSERLTEVDTDDTCSVARSDDTARSEVESRGDPDDLPSSKFSYQKLVLVSIPSDEVRKGSWKV